MTGCVGELVNNPPREMGTGGGALVEGQFTELGGGGSSHLISNAAKQRGRRTTGNEEKREE